MIGVVQKWNVRTTGMGIGGALVILGGFLMALLDGDPKTVPDWDALVGTIMLATGLVFARDSNVTSEQAGAK